MTKQETIQAIIAKAFRLEFVDAKTDSSVKVDLVIPGKMADNPDVNINRLELTPNGIMVGEKWSKKLQFNEILECIRTRKFIPEERLAKIEGKGYKVK